MKKAVYEFYTNLGKVQNIINEMIEECRLNWVNDTPFENEECDKWTDLEEKLIDINDILNDEPFFKNEE